MNLPAVHSAGAPLAISLPASTPVVTAATLPRAVTFGESTYRFAGPLGNLSEAAKPVFEALQAAAALPPSSNPGFVLPANGDFLRLFSAVTAIAAERIYPAPIFSFSA
ncbi:MAG TPA: hypothetical protein VMG98_15195 [Verrucomicrobiae bacterium]|nr:hypothetical protein [Verrucomicrobiae bacterium]